MSTATLVVASDVITLIVSLCLSALLFGTRWGELRADVKNIERDVAEIKGAFTLTPRQP